MNKLYLKCKNKVASPIIVPGDATVLLGCYNYVPLEEYAKKHKEFKAINCATIDVHKVLRF
jgi:hypothetical protein